ncbi:MAG: 30S ribosomal protein S13 [Candidatus Pacearchaeota archaeon]
MAEQKQKEQKEVKKVMAEPKQKKGRPDDHLAETLVRIYSKDIPGDRPLYVGLTYIKGISWSISNAMCHILKMDKKIKISNLTKEQIESIEAFLQKPQLYDYLKNHQRDYESGESKHILTNELDMTREFDIKRMKQIKSYKGMRHSLKQPVRGQRTRSHFRTIGVAVGVKKKAAGK